MYCRDIPVVFQSAQGSVLRDEEGREYLDFFAGAGALNYGHNDPEMRAALIEHLESNSVAHGLDLFTSTKRALLESLEASLLTPRGWDYRIQFTGPTGADANEAALKLARKATGRTGIVTFNGAFHGMTAGTLAVSGARSRKLSGGDLTDDVLFVPFENGPYGPYDSLAFLERQVSDPRSGVEKPAAVIVESVQIQAGVYAATDDWLRRLREWTRSNGILLILDEIQAGCGRTGDFFGFERSGITPDIVTCAKSIGGFGLPMALALLSPEADVWEPGDHTGTFRGNQLAFVTARIAIERWNNSSFVDVVRRNTQIMEQRVAEIAALPGVASTRARGLIAGIDFGLGQTAAAAETQARALAAGLLVERCGPNSEVIKLMPPIATPPEELERGLRILSDSILSN